MGEFFPLGSGYGTFPHLFWRFYPPDMQFDGIIDCAHNDYLEWLIEGGIIMTVLLGIFLLTYLRQWPVVWYRGIWSTFRFVQVGAGISLLLMGLHSFVDFNLHIPANAVFLLFWRRFFSTGINWNTWNISTDLTTVTSITIRRLKLHRRQFRPCSPESCH
ncbi:MAG: hypothetical protein R3F37_04415 [Candidatus Competibacteraceae bacterium]